jgi:protein-disulfide isomerase
MQSTVIAALGAALCGLVAVARPATADKAGFDPAAVYRVPVGDSPSLGPADAPVTIIEFSDFYCPHCNRAAGTLADLMRIYPGQLRLVYRHNLLDSRNGTLAAQAAMAAHDQGKFWAMHDLLFSSAEPIRRAVIDEYAYQLGLDMVRFRTAVDSGAALARIKEDVALAERLGVAATPMLFINGRPITGAQALGVFVELIQTELARTEDMISRGADPAGLYDAAIQAGRDRAGPIAPGADQPGERALDVDATYPVGLGLTSHQRGSADALVTIVEFSDFECGFCRRSRDTLRALRSELGHDLRVVYRHKPLVASGNTKLVAEAAVAAGEQGKFWEFHDRAFAHDGRIRRDDIERFAREIDLDMERFRSALDDRRHLREVIAEAADAAALGVRGTPTFFINGTPVIGAVPLAKLRAVALEKKAEALALVKAGVAKGDVYAEVIRRGAGARREASAVPGDPIDDQIAVLVACRAKDAAAAAAAFGRLKGKARRTAVRKDCKRLGIALPK